MSEAREPAILDRIYTIAEVDGACFLARQSGLYRLASSNGAARNLYQGWQPEEEIATLDIAMSPRFPQDGLILAGLNGGVARSEDGGATWAALAMRSPAPLVTCLALSPAFASDPRVMEGSYEDGIFRSDDAGQGWAAFNFGLFDHKIFCLALSPDYPVDGVVMAGTSSGLYRSDNGGRLWQDLTMPAGDEAVLSLAFSPEYADDRTILAGTESQGLLRSLPRFDRQAAGGDRDRLSEMPGLIPSIYAKREGCMFAPRCPLASAHCREAEPPLVAVEGEHWAAGWEATP